MEKVLGPTISVSQDTIYITGTSEDNLSGTAIYRYDPPNSQGEIKNVDTITTELFTAPQFELTTSGKWTFYAQDAAGNSDTKQTSSITLYRCNYCNKKTVQLHYNCPDHASSTDCTLSVGDCNYIVPWIACRQSPCYSGDYFVSDYPANDHTYCPACGKLLSKNSIYSLRYVPCKSHLDNKTTGVHSFCADCDKKGLLLTYNNWNGEKCDTSYYNCPGVSDVRCSLPLQSDSTVL